MIDICPCVELMQWWCINGHCFALVGSKSISSIMLTHLDSLSAHNTMTMIGLCAPSLHWWWNITLVLIWRAECTFLLFFVSILFCFLFRFCFGLCLVLEVLLVCGGLWGRIRLLFTCYYNGNDWCASFFLLEMVELSRDYPAGQPDRTFCNILSFYLQGVIIFGLITVQDCDLTWIHWQHTRTQRW